MPLPIDFSSSLWFMPTGVWEWEPVPPVVPPPESLDAARDAAATDSAQPSDAEAKVCPGEPARRLVFKGFVNSSQFHWFYADSPASRPWEQVDLDEPVERKARRAEPKHHFESDAAHSAPGDDVFTARPEPLQSALEAQRDATRGEGPQADER
jgi:hypothetical protein